jgi:hypothetical protein
VRPSAPVAHQPGHHTTRGNSQSHGECRPTYRASTGLARPTLTLAFGWVSVLHARLWCAEGSRPGGASGDDATSCDAASLSHFARCVSPPLPSLPCAGVGQQRGEAGWQLDARGAATHAVHVTAKSAAAVGALAVLVAAQLAAAESPQQPAAGCGAAHRHVGGSHHAHGGCSCHPSVFATHPVSPCATN